MFKKMLQFISTKRRISRFFVGFRFSNLFATPLVICLAFLSGFAKEAHAQAPSVLVGNRGSTVENENYFVPYAIEFVTGVSSASVTSVQIQVGTTLDGDRDTSVVIRERNSSGRPGTLVAKLDNPNTFKPGVLNTFTPPADTNLTPSKSYFLVINDGRPRSPGENIPFQMTQSSAENGLPDSSISDTGFYQSGLNRWQTSSLKPIFRINNTAGSVPDTTRPTVNISGITAGSSDPFIVTFVFSEFVTDFIEGDIVVENGVASEFAGSGTTYTVKITPSMTNLAPPVVVKVPDSVAEDTSGNGNIAAMSEIAVEPRVTSIIRLMPEDSSTNADQLTWRVIFNEKMWNVDVTDFEIAGTDATLTVTGSGDRYDVTASGGDLADLDGRVRLLFASKQDIQAVASGDRFIHVVPTDTKENTFDLDNTRPTVDISNVPSNSTGAFIATFTFSEVVTGFAVGDISVNNGAASELTGSGVTYTATITPINHDLVTIDVPENVVQDAAGNGNTAATQATSTYEDTIAPRVLSIARQTPADSPTKIISPTWRVTFDEAVERVNAEDFFIDTIVKISSPKIVVEPVSGTQYDVTGSSPSFSNFRGEVKLKFTKDQDIQDRAGNPLSNTIPTTVDDIHEIDTLRPTVVIGDIPRISTGAFIATFTFSEAVTGFAASDIKVANGVASDLIGSGAIYTATITPKDNGPVTVNMLADVVENAAKNGNIAATTVISIYDSTASDTTAPRIRSITRLIPVNSPVNAYHLTWEVIFSEPVKNLDHVDFRVNGRAVYLSTSGSGARYRVTLGYNTRLFLGLRNGLVRLTFNTNQNIQDVAGNALVNTTPMGGMDYSYEIDAISPRVVVNVPGTSTGAFIATFTFSEAVTGFAVSDVIVGNGMASAFTGSGTIYTATITPTQNGPVTVDVPAVVAEDFAGNGNVEAIRATSDFTAADTTAPRVRSITRLTPANSPTNANSLSWRVTFSEPVERVSPSDFRVVGTDASLTVTGSADSYNVLASGGNLAGLTGMVRLSFADSQSIRDVAGNALLNTRPTGTNHNTFMVENTRPTVAISGVPNTSTGAFTAIFTFSEAVQGFDVADISVSNGMASVFGGSGTIYTATITPTQNGSITVGVPVNVAEDTAGNGNTVATTVRSTYSSTAADTIAPRIQSITRPMHENYWTNADSLSWRVTFSEPVERVSPSDFRLAGAIGASFVVTGSGARYDVTASGGNLADLTGPVTFTFSGSQDIQDVAGNALVDTTTTGVNLRDLGIDNIAPTVVVSDIPSTITGAFTATFTFSKTVTGFTVDDISVFNGVASVFTGSRTTYTATITPTETGSVTVGVPANVAEDVAGNGNAAAPLTTSIYDPAALRVASIIRPLPNSSPTNADRLTWRVTFSKPVRNVSWHDFKLVGTTALLAVTTDSTTQYEVTTASLGDLEDLNGLVTLSFADDQNIEDTFGNALSNTMPTGTNHNTYEVDNTAPTVVVSDVPSTSRNAFTATFTFSEAVTGFAVGDISVFNGVASALVGSGTTYTATITPTKAGSVGIEVLSNVAEDAAGNGNTIATQAISTYDTTASDTTAPRIQSITRLTPDRSPTNANILVWRVTFSEPIIRLRNVNFAVVGIASDQITVTGSGASYEVSCEIHQSNHDINGLVKLYLNRARVIKDIAGNDLSDIVPIGLDESTYELDNIRPRVIVSGVPKTGAGAFSATFTFSEAVTGFTIGDLMIENGVSSAFDGSGRTYTATITPTNNSRPVIVRVPDNVAEDAAGNLNLQAEESTANYDAPIPDTTAPQIISISRLTPNSSPTNADSLTWRVTFSEPVERVSSEDFQIFGSGLSGNTSLAVALVGGDATQYDVTVSAGNLGNFNGRVLLGFFRDQNIRDLAGNDLSDTVPTGTNENTYEVDNTAPTVVISDVPGTSTGAFTVTVTFSEGVTGFAVGDISVNNGAASELTGYGRTYTAKITPTSNGSVTIDVPANAAEDAAGNGSTIATQATLTYDNTAADNTLPQVRSMTRLTPANSPTNADSLTWRVIFSEPVMNLDETDFRIVGVTNRRSFDSELGIAVTANSPTQYDVTFSSGEFAIKRFNGRVRLYFRPGQNIQDIAGNALTDIAPTSTSIGQRTYEVDNTSPTIVVSGVPAVVTGPFIATFTFSEPVEGFTIEDIDRSFNTSGRASEFTGSRSIYRATIRPTDRPFLILELPGKRSHDYAGNPSKGLRFVVPVNHDVETIDTTAPWVRSIVHQAPAKSPTNADRLIWRVTFSEPVTDLDASDFEITGTTGTLSVSAVPGSPTTWVVTASGGNLAGLTGPVTLSFAASQNIVDNFGNVLVGTIPTGTNESTYEVDNTGPTVVISELPHVGYMSGITVVFTFSEAVTGFEQNDIVLHNFSLLNFKGSGTTYTAKLTLTNHKNSGSVRVPANVAQDVLGNGNIEGEARTGSVPVENRVISIIRQSPTHSLTSADRLTWQVIFNKRMKNVDESDFQIDGTTASIVKVRGVGSEYEVTAGGGNLASLTGPVKLSFASTSSENILTVGGQSLDSYVPLLANEDVYEMDNTAPKVESITRLIPANSPTNADRLTWRVTFNEPVKDVDVRDFEVAGTESTLFDVTGSGMQWDVTVSGDSLAIMNGTVTLSFSSGRRIEDLAGNVLTGNTPIGTNHNTYEVDNIAPTVAISNVPTKSQAAFDVTFTFSEAVTGFALDDIRVGNGVASSLTATTPNTVFIARIIPTGDGPVTLSVVGNAAIDASGNGNPFSGLASSSYDGSAPQIISISRKAPTGLATNADSLTWRVTFNEPVVNVDEADFEVTGTTASITDLRGLGARYDVTVSGGNLAGLNGPVTLSLNSAQNIADSAAYALNDLVPTDTNENSYEVDNRAPTVGINGVPGTSTTAFPATFIFSEAVVGFTVDDISVSNGVASELTGSRTTYRAMITPTSSGSVTVDMLQGMVKDTAGNANLASLPASSSYTAPVLIFTPAELAVAEGGSNTYTVALSTQPAGNVMVTVSGISKEVTVDTDSNTSGNQNRLSFTSSDWHIGKTIRVSAGPDDDTDDETVILTHIATGAADYGLVTGDIVVTVSDTTSLSHVQSAFLTRFGRTVGQQSVDAVMDRLEANRNSGFTGQLAGHALPKMTGGVLDESVKPAGVVSDDRSSVNLEHLEEIERILSGVEDEATGTGNRVGESGRLNSDEILTGTSFALNLEDGNGSSYALWGRGAYSGFESVEGNLKLEAEVSSYMLGADWKQESYLLGLMLSRSKGEGDYGYSDDKGEIETELTALIPYLGWDVTDRITIWTSVGFGQGEMTLSETGGLSLSTDIDWQMLAGGSSGELGSVRPLGGAQVRWTADAMWTRTDWKASAGLPSSSWGDSTRFRLGLEGRWENRLASGAKWTPHLEYGLRYDGGDAESGYGLEIGGGVDWSDPSRGLEMGVEGRRLALHQDENLKDWGLAFNFAFDPYPQTKRGFRAQFSHDFGGASSGGVVALLNPDFFPEGTESNSGDAWRAELTYGFRRDIGMVGSPYTRLSGGVDGFDGVRLGYRMEPETLEAANMTLDLWAQPEIESDDANGTEAGVELRRQW